MKKRIPTILGLAILVIGVVAGVALVDQGTGGFLPRANEEAVPQQVRITNITDTTFTVSFVTQANSLGLLEYGVQAKKLNDQVLDDRDQLTDLLRQVRAGGNDFDVEHSAERIRKYRSRLPDESPE